MPTPVPSPLAGPCWWMPRSGPRPHHERQRPCSACCDSCRAPRRLPACIVRGTGQLAGPEEAAAVCQEQKTGQFGQHAATESSLLPQPQQPHPPGLHQPRGMEVSFSVCKTLGLINIKTLRVFKMFSYPSLKEFFPQNVNSVIICSPLFRSKIRFSLSTQWRSKLFIPQLSLKCFLLQKKKIHNLMVRQL